MADGRRPGHLGKRRVSDDVHVLPVKDMREHEERRDCWCAPRLEFEANGCVVVHHSMDGRELVEKHGIQ